jgi:hypothetical protein
MLNKPTISADIDKTASIITIHLNDGQLIVMLTEHKQIENERKKLNQQLRNTQLHPVKNNSSYRLHIPVTRAKSHLIQIRKLFMTKICCMQEAFSEQQLTEFRHDGQW